MKGNALCPLFKLIKNQDMQTMGDKADKSDFAALFSSHPPLEKRIQALREGQ